MSQMEFSIGSQPGAARFTATLSNNGEIHIDIGGGLDVVMMYLDPRQACTLGNVLIQMSQQAQEDKAKIEEEKSKK
jgi:hypothetical protein